MHFNIYVWLELINLIAHISIYLSVTCFKMMLKGVFIFEGLETSTLIEDGKKGKQNLYYL